MVKPRTMHQEIPDSSLSHVAVCFGLEQVTFPQLLSQVWGISENRDQSYRSNARPRLTSAGLPSLVSYLTTVSLF